MTEAIPSPQNAAPAPQGKKLWFTLFFGVLVLLLVGAGVMLFRVGTTFSVVSERVHSFLGINPSELPPANPAERNRIDVLVLGIRGEGDPHGGLLTDMMLLVSVNTETNEVALISIPRDIWLEIPLVSRHGKINEAYALGEKIRPRGGGLLLSKLAAQEVAGVNIDYAVSVDFAAFKEIVDHILGGIEVEVAKPLLENQQWGGIDFYIPAGTQHMDGDTALYYVRSRFTTSDFDRARRQQEVLLAMRKKASELGILTNPSKIFSVLDILGRHVRIDAGAEDILQGIQFARNLTQVEPKRLVLDTTSGLLRSATVQGSYVLLPQEEDFSSLRAVIRNIFEQ